MKEEFEKLFIDDDFRKLREKVNKINIFDILKISETEIRHSNVLAWLLDPNENHEFHDIFLRKFLCLIDIPNFEKFNFDNVIVKREWKNIDILVIITEPSNRYVIAIENKINSAENGTQLKKYTEIIRAEFPNNVVYNLYLVPDNNLNNRGDNKSENTWKDLLYSEIIRILKELIEENTTPNDILKLEFIQQYYTVLTKIIDMEDTSEIDKLCASLWQKNKNALEQLLNYKQNRINQLFAFLCNRIKDDVIFKSKIWFKTKKMDQYFDNYYAEILNYQIYKGQNIIELYLYLGVGDELIRQQVFDILNKSGILKRLFIEMPKGQYNIMMRIPLIEVNLCQNENIEIQIETLNRNWNATYEILQKIDELF